MRSTHIVGTLIKFASFAVVTLTATGLLFAIFADFRTGERGGYTAVFTDASSLKAGDSVRVAGVRVGTVTAVSLQPDNSVLVNFATDPSINVTTGTKVAIRYLDLIGNRYVELIDGPGSTHLLPIGSRIPADRTTPALDLDLLLGGLKPVIRGLNPQDINKLTAALLHIFQGRGETTQSLLARTAAFSNTLADNNAAIEQMLTNLDTVVQTLSKDGEKFSEALDRFAQLVTGFAADRESIGEAIDALSKGTTSVADLLSQARSPLADNIDQINRLAAIIDSKKKLIDAAIQRAPENYRKLARAGSYGSFVNYYLCGISVRLTDLQGRTAVFPWIQQQTGRCSEP